MYNIKQNQIDRPNPLPHDTSGGNKDKKVTDTLIRHICPNLPQVQQHEDQFKQLVLNLRLAGGDAGRYGDLLRHWDYAKRMLQSLDLDILTLSRNPEIAYGFFVKSRLSLSYAQKVIRVLNAFGEFIGYQTNQFVPPIKNPRGFHKERIVDAFNASTKDSAVSGPLTKELLDRAKEFFSDRPAYYNWLFISFYFGLRPSEVDSLKDSQRYYVKEVSGIPVLFVYQNKLQKIARDKRWKLIPAILPEQREALQLVTSQNFERPSVFLIQKATKQDITTYGGRKGFTSMLMKQGLELREISQMMGHKDLKTTVNHYSDPIEVQLVNIKRSFGGRARS